MGNITLASENKTPSILIADTLNTIEVVAIQPALVQVSAVTVGTTFDVMGKVHTDAPWSILGSYDDTDGEVIQTFPQKYNFVKVVRTAGIVDFLAHAQS